MSLALDQLIDPLVVKSLSLVGQRRGEASPVIISQITLVVILLRDRDSLLGKDLTEELEMNGFIVDQNAVEVKYDSLDHWFLQLHK